MKLILLIRWLIPCVFVSLVFSCANDSVSKTEDQKEKEFAIKWKIKSIIEYKSAFGISENELINHEKFFDENGFKQKEISFSEGKTESITTYEYDKNGNLLNSNGIKPDSSFLFKATMNYDENNQRKEVYFYLPDGTYKYRTLATYNKDGKMIELKYYWPDGLKARNKYIYEGNKKIEDTEYSPDGEFRYKWIYKYDSNDNVIEAVQYYTDNRINLKIDYEYNSENLLVRQTNFFGESIKNSITFEYINKTLLSSKTETTSGGTRSAKYTYHYEFY